MLLENGTSRAVDYILLTTGNVGNQDARPSVVSGFSRQELEQHPRFIPEPYPIERVQEIRAERVGLLGLGLSFIDVAIALTEGRGGKFRRNTTGRLEYVPSGSEPQLLAWSRSGRPLLARGVNEKGVAGAHRPRFLTPGAIDLMCEERGKLDFLRDLLPLIEQEMAYAYYVALLGTDQRESIGDSVARGCVPEGVGYRFTFDSLAQPPELARRWYPDAREYLLSLTTFMEADIEDAYGGNASNPAKAACEVLRDLRDTLRYAVEYERLTPTSHRQFNEHFASVNNRLSVGPPVVRNEQILAMVRSGILDIAWGPGAVCNMENDGFRVDSTAFASRKTGMVDVLVDCRAGHRESELARRLVYRKLARLARNRGPDDDYQLRTIEVTRDSLVVDGFGEADLSISAMGQLAEGTLWYTQVAARPGVNSRSLGDAARWAHSVVNSIVRDSNR